MNKLFNFYLVLSFIFITSTVQAQTVYTFTNCGKNGRLGPSQNFIDVFYTGTTLANQVTVSTQGVQEWNVPSTGLYSIEVEGAEGGRFGTQVPGKGARVSGEFTLIQGSLLKIVVGQLGGNTTVFTGAGGGGGSFVVTGANVPLIVAAGGAGTSGSAGDFGRTFTGGSGATGNPNVAGIRFAQSGGAGGSFATDPNDSESINTGQSGRSFLAGAMGGLAATGNGGSMIGGFGGGGGGGYFSQGGAGGGYQGGNGGQANYNSNGGPTAALSYNSGTNQINLSNVGTGHGHVIITRIFGADITSSTNVTCNGGSDGSMTVTVVGGTAPYDYAWSSGASTLNSNALTNTANGLSAGIYTVTVTDDNGNTATASGTITQPLIAVTASASVSNTIDCNGNNNGVVLASATGGIGFTYSWNTGGTSASETGLAAGTYSVTVTDNLGCTDSASVVLTQPSQLIAAASINTAVSCNGDSDGSVNASATGGVSSYTYSWNTGGTSATEISLMAGTYSVTITDQNGCTDSASVNLTDPSILTVTATNTGNANCNGGNAGSANALAVGGTGNKTYTWSNGGNSAAISGLTAGTYTVTATDDNGCTATSTVVITEPIALTVVANNTGNVLCNGGSTGSANVTATGGTGNKTYLWSNGSTATSISGLTAGTYTVTVTDANACTVSATVSITEPLLLVADAGSPVNVSCNGNNDGSASAVAIGGTGPYNYAWSNAVNNAINSGVSAGVYTVTITDANNCTATDTVAITEPALISLSISNATNVSCNNGNNGSALAVTVGGIAPYNYLWSNGGIAALNNTLTAGSYTVTVTDNNGCTESSAVVITEPTALLSQIDSVLNVSCNGDTSGYASAIASGGTSPYTYAWSNSAATAAITGLPTGSYTVTITDGNNCTATSTVAITEPTALVAAIDSQLNVACDADTNGYASVLATGGTAPYTYAWSNGGSMMSTNTLDTGAYMVTVTDALGCTQEVGDTIIAIDSIVPTVLTQNIMVYLDSNGVAMIDVMSIDSGSFDNCVIDTMYLDTNMFDCNAIGINTVVLTVVDAVGNMASASAMVTVADTLAPVLMVQDVTIFLDANGNATLTAMDVDNGSMDNCGIDSMTLDQNTFNCANLGTNQVLVSATDLAGNTTSTSVAVTVVDTLPPVVLAGDYILYLDEQGNGIISTSMINAGSSDNCDMFMMLSDSLFTCSDEGNNMVALIGTDLSGNIGVDSFMVTVIDTHNQIAAITGFMEREQGAVVDYMVDSVAGATYEWTVTNGTGVANGSMITVTWNADTTMGSLEVIQTTSLGCADTASNMITLWALGADDAIEAGMMIFPNPTRGELTLRSAASGKRDVALYDLLGNKVIEVNGADFSADYKMDLSYLAKGQYQLVISTASKQAVYRVVVQ